MDTSLSTPLAPVAAEAPSSASQRDTIAVNRARPSLDARTMANVPHDFQTTGTEERRRRLRVLPGELTAEAAAALTQMAAHGEEMKGDLGDLAPAWTAAQPLAERFDALVAARDRLAALVQYNDELLAIATHDVLKYLEDANTEYQHRVSRRPQLAQRYSKLAAFFEARSRAIAEGIARARQEAERAGEPGR